MNNYGVISPVLEDAYIFCEQLGKRYGIHMHQVQKPNIYTFVGELYTMCGTPMRINILVYPRRTDIKVVTMNMQCVYQKSYITAADSKALSKSVGLFNFLDKAYRTM